MIDDVIHVRLFESIRWVEALHALLSLRTVVD